MIREVLQCGAVQCEHCQRWFKNTEASLSTVDCAIHVKCFCSPIGEKHVIRIRIMRACVRVCVVRACMHACLVCVCVFVSVCSVYLCVPLLKL